LPTTFVLFEDAGLGQFRQAPGQDAGGDAAASGLEITKP
jgi:hypothetical protein